MSYVVLQVGQCGNQLGHDLFSTISEILNSKDYAKTSNFLENTSERFFSQSIQGEKRLARAVLVDTEPKVIKQILSNPKDAFWSYQYNCHEIKQLGAGNNWAMGYYEYGEFFKESTLNLIRKEVERCDSFAGFIVLLSVAGGTGSGLGCLLSELLRDEFPNTSSVNVAVWPFKKGEVSVQTYNAVLSLAHLQSSSDAIIIYENDQLLKLCQQRMHLQEVSLHDLNIIASQQLANLLLPANSCSGTNLQFNDLLAHLVPHPQFKLLGLQSVPQEPISSLPFSANSWNGLLRTLRRMVLYNSIVDEIQGSCDPVRVTRSSPVSLSNLLILRGRDSGSADPNHLHQPSLPYSSWVSPQSRFQLFTHPKPFLCYDKTAILANNGQLSIPGIDAAMAKAWKMFSWKSYFHHYEKYGLSKDSFLESVLCVEQIISSYKSLSF